MEGKTMGGTKLQVRFFFNFSPNLQLQLYIHVSNVLKHEQEINVILLFYVMYNIFGISS